MKTTVITSGKTNQSANGIANTGVVQSKNFDGDNTANTKLAHEVKPATVNKAEEAKPVPVITVATGAETEKVEPTKADIREQMAVKKPALNLECTLKLVEELHRRKIQRDKLIGTIDTLEEFEVAQKNEAEETDSNHFQGCELTIEDDQRREFVTKNPVIIKRVAEYIHALCVDRLAEIEGEIFLPA
ncbi:MAG: hypothetical protein P0Y49_04770 [Candidatus Pedobacter colombiensis]|uniref:Uncharacterized protein n=1 Tax=Candidatus Pedobacter colombiensis TaxID=3121371 RepID=A0AAJ5W9Y1_9SPHI|nr:hypothetical protein [Pedobacter sp.]WEK20450.1 MAG: hypothetical protein P0Y49_04770 [Pedobacter sp.]